MSSKDPEPQEEQPPPPPPLQVDESVIAYIERSRTAHTEKRGGGPQPSEGEDAGRSR